MGIISVLLYSQGLMGGFHVPGWVVIGCYVAMGLARFRAGGRLSTMGSRITKLSHHQGFCASMGGSLLLFGATAFGIPVSTTHTITGCIMGVGAPSAPARCAGAWRKADCGLGGHHSGSSPGGAAFYWVAVAIDRMV
jgi:PiT family inorganic phosphate transporter